MNIRVLLTGATGIAGEGVLLECLRDPTVESVLLLGRKPSSYAHSKLQELLRPDFQHLETAENRLTGYNACFYCAGISSLGVSKEEYEPITYATTLAVAQTLRRLPFRSAFMFRPGSMRPSPGQRNVLGMYKYL